MCEYPCLDVGPERMFFTECVVFCFSGYEEFWEHLSGCARCKGRMVTALAVLWSDFSFRRRMAGMPLEVVKRAVAPGGVVVFRDKGYMRELFLLKNRSFESTMKFREFIDSL